MASLRRALVIICTVAFVSFATVAAAGLPQRGSQVGDENNGAMASNPSTPTFSQISYQLVYQSGATPPSEIELDWQLNSQVNTATPSCRLVNQDGSLTMDTLPKPTADRDNPLLYRMLLPFGHNTHLDPALYANLQCNLEVALSTGAPVTSPYMSVSLRDMDEALTELKHPSRAGDLHLNVVSCKVYDSLMAVGVTANRPADIQITAKDASSGNSSKGTGTVHRSSGNTEPDSIIVPNLRPNGTTYQLALQELDAQDNPIGDQTSFNDCQATKGRITTPNIGVEGITENPISVSFTATGLSQGDHLYYEIVQRKNGRPTATPSKVDESLKEIGFTGDNSQVTIPFSVAADPGVTYDLFVTAQSKDAPTPKEAGESLADYRSEVVDESFNGIDPLITKSFQLTLEQDDLKISAATTVPAKLVAVFVTPGNGQASSSQITNQLAAQSFAVDPNFTIPYSSLGSPSANTPPALDLTLKDQNGREQTAQITLAVSTQVSSGKAKAQTQVNQILSTAQQSPNKTSAKGNWGALLETGIGAILKFFAFAP